MKCTGGYPTRNANACLGLRAIAANSCVKSLHSKDLKVPPRGIEADDVSTLRDNDLGNLPEGLRTECGTLLNDPAFLILVSAWPHLSEDDRKAILETVRQASQAEGPSQ
jgi:hypothetical protein